MHQLDIKTKRLHIRRFTESDITEEYISWLNDKELMRYSEQRHQEHTSETSKKYLLSFFGTPNFFLALDTTGGEMIGTMTIYQDIHNKVCNIGILIGSPRSRGKGFGFEAWDSVIKWIELNLAPRKITAGAMHENQSMLKLMRKSNMQEDGRRRGYFLLDGKSVDLVVMSLNYDTGAKK